MIVGLLLAAGGARRFGSQKLVAVLDGQPIVRHAAETLARATDHLVVVVGHASDDVRAALTGVDATIVENRDWVSGLSTSLRCGIAHVPPNTEAVIVGLGDQPRVDLAVYRDVIETWRTTARPIVSARYAGVRGHPVLFARSVFPQLLETIGDAGARMLIERAPERVAYVDVDADVPLDVDSPADLTALRHADSHRMPSRGIVEPHEPN